MSLPVDYWDYLGWKDTLALHGHSTRERAYADARGDREVYTPQVVVNGVAHAVGSDKGAIEQAIEQTRRNDASLTVPVTMTVADGKVTVNVPASAKDQPARKSGSARSLKRRKLKSIAVKTRPHVDLLQRGAPLGETGHLERQGGKLQRAAGQPAGCEFFVARHRPLTVVVQSGAATKPGLMLGAATASLR